MHEPRQQATLHAALYPQRLMERGSVLEQQYLELDSGATHKTAVKDRLGCLSEYGISIR